MVRKNDEALLREYRKDAKEQKEKLVTTKRKIHDIEQKIKLPQLAEIYEGNYYKFLNGEGEKNWPIYIYVEKVLTASEVIGHIFEIMNSDQKIDAKMINIELRTIISTSLLTTKITKTQYKDVVKQMFDQINLLHVIAK